MYQVVQVELGKYRSIKACHICEYHERRIDKMLWELGGYFQEGDWVKLCGGGGAWADPQERICFLKGGGGRSWNREEWMGRAIRVNETTWPSREFEHDGKGGGEAECISVSLENIFRGFGISDHGQACRLSLAMTEGLAWLMDSAVNKKDGSPAPMKLPAHQNKPIQKIFTMCGEL